MFFNRFAKREAPFPLIVGMSGVKMGDRVLQIGCAHGGHLAAIAAKVGLSGRALAVVKDDAAAERVQKASANAGVLVEVEIAPATRLPVDDASVDLAIVDDTDGSFGTMAADDRAASLREMLRVVRPGGRAMIIGAVPGQGLTAILSGAPKEPSFASSGAARQAFEDAGFRAARTLAEREGLVFVEGIKRRE
ncbi:MAG TPA: methyltransferase domain-containing protein [Vicinamibacterales bacterium]|jgi:SAM-dependent methyltransferase